MSYAMLYTVVPVLIVAFNVCLLHFSSHFSANWGRLENVDHCGGEPEQADTGTVLYH